MTQAGKRQVRSANTILLATIVAAGLSAAKVRADLATLDVAEDTYVKRSDVSTTHGHEFFLRIKNDVGGAISDQDRNAYLRFDTSSINGTVTSASLSLDLVNHIGVPHSIGIAVIRETASAEAFAESTLASGNSDVWSNANDEGIHFPSLIGAGAITISDADQGNTITFDDPDLVSALNNDTNGMLSLVLFRAYNHAGTDVFASSENRNFNPPRLNIEYTPAAMPSPDSCMMALIGAVVLFARRPSRRVPS